MSPKPTEFDRMVSGHFYNPDDKDLQAIHLAALAQCQRFNQVPVDHTEEKEAELMKLIPSAKDHGLGIFTPFYCEYGRNIHVGNGCFINYNCVFLDVAPITLGDNVWIGANVTIATPDHPFLAAERLVTRYPDGFHDLEYAKPVTIEKNCWIASSVTICGGVTIGEGSIIAAGAVVTRDIPAHSIAAGVPARVMRPIDEKDRMNVWETYQANETPVSERDRDK